jgi:hypothetical protein
VVFHPHAAFQIYLSALSSGATPRFHSCKPGLSIKPSSPTNEDTRLVIFQFTIAPKSTYEREHSKVSTSANDEENVEATTEETLVAVEINSDRIVGVMFGKTASQQIFSLWWL